MSEFGPSRRTLLAVGALVAIPVAGLALLGWHTWFREAKEQPPPRAVLAAPVPTPARPPPTAPVTAAAPASGSTAITPRGPPAGVTEPAELCEWGVASACTVVARARQQAGDKTQARRYAEQSCDGSDADGCYLLAMLTDDLITRRVLHRRSVVLRSCSPALGCANGMEDWRSIAAAERIEYENAQKAGKPKLDEETRKALTLLAERQRAIQALPTPPARPPYEWPPRTGGACTTRSDCNSPFLTCGSSGTCVEDRATQMARELGVRPSTYQPPRPRTPEEEAQLLHAMGLARGEDGVVTSNGRMAFDPNTPRQPLHGLPLCLGRARVCLAKGTRHQANGLDACVLSIPRCTTATPWLGDDPAGADCCPAACIERYFEQRKLGLEVSAALIFARSGCYPGIPPIPD